MTPRRTASPRLSGAIRRSPGTEAVVGCPSNIFFIPAGGMNRYLAGAVAGALATVPMTLVMIALHRRLPRRQRYPLPPRQITANVAARVGAGRLLTGDRMTAATLAAHFGYGAAVGSLYAVLADGRRAKNLYAGGAYGVAVWALSYLGWIPALRILPPATRHPMPRNALMLLSHLVWGAALAGSNAFILRLRASKNTPYLPSAADPTRRSARQIPAVKAFH